ncbi:hypothetical protein QQZ08_006839 [Neonectria magnoliae]|uniref:CFEM domain-containing protein n=1 Tax=Neonectria magnoliae TaxID=2732573 RepID=A0ABR1I190_9HYPO
MKISIAVAALASVSAVAAFPLCALTCFNTVMAHPTAATCTEANMFLCMCKIKALTLAYRDCVCANCSTAATKKEAIKEGKDTCVCKY